MFDFIGPLDCYWIIWSKPDGLVTIGTMVAMSVIYWLGDPVRGAFGRFAVIAFYVAAIGALYFLVSLKPYDTFGFLAMWGIMISCMCTETFILLFNERHASVD